MLLCVSIIHGQKSFNVDSLNNENQVKEKNQKRKALKIYPDSILVQETSSVSSGATYTPRLDELLKYDPDAKNYIPGNEISDEQIEFAKSKYYHELYTKIGIGIGSVLIVGLFIFFIYKLLK